MEGLPIKSRRQVREDDGGGASNFFGTPTLALALDPGLTLVELRYCSVGVPKEFRRSSEGVPKEFWCSPMVFIIVPRHRKLIRWAQGYKAVTGSSWYFEWTPLVFWALFYRGLVMPKKPITTAQNTKTGVLANAIVPALIHAQHQIVM